MTICDILLIVVVLLHVDPGFGVSCNSRVQVSYGDTGTITSPNYPNLYPDNTECVYTLIGLDVGSHVTLTFTAFDLESHTSCRYDSLEVFNGASTFSLWSSTLIRKMCGNAIPAPITRTGKDLTIRFRSDGSQSKTGFSITYAVVCGFTLSETSGRIQSPGFPNRNYPNSWDCTYSIQPTEGSQILLTFHTFGLEGNASCSGDYLDLSIPGLPIKKYCGSMSGFRKLINSTQLTLNFHSDGVGPTDQYFRHSDRSRTRHGFTVSYKITTSCRPNKSICRHNCLEISTEKVLCTCNSGFNLAEDGVSCDDCDSFFSATSGTIQSPGYPTSFPSSADCTFTIQPTQGKQILLNFTSFDLIGSGVGSSCLRRIHDNYLSLSVSDRPVERYCGDKTGLTKLINSSQLTLKFHSGNVHYGGGKKQGFSINYKISSNCSVDNGGCSHNCVDISAREVLCSCPSGLQLDDGGASCIDINECNIDHPCDHVCTNTDGSYRCSCFSRGYQLASDNKTCEDIDECVVNSPCSDMCTNRDGWYQCSCTTPGFELSFDQRTCADIDECSIDNPCEDVCTNTNGSYACSCATPGYGLSSDNRTCVDIDECMDHVCAHTCRNVPGGWECSCFKGYEVDEKDETECVDIDECTRGLVSDSCDDCINSQGSFECVCADGFLPNDNNTECSDINECENSNGGCQQEATCTNTIGSFKCNCPAGYIVNDVTSCLDIDECVTSDHGCAQVCNNSPGSYSCSCSPGYAMTGDECVDIDECKSSTPCQHICHNSEGSYRCDCNLGYFLVGNGFNCTDRNYCEADLDDCEHICVNEIGYHRCECNPGYTLNSDNATCSDINECEGGESGCSDGCLNLSGRFTCYCRGGYELGADNKTCQDVDECANNNGECQHICTNADGTFSCGCHDGYILSKNTHCTDINECATSNGKCSQICENNEGAYECQCEPNFKLGNDSLSCEHCPTCEEFQQISRDVARLNRMEDSVEELTDSNLRLNAKIADLQQQINALRTSNALLLARIEQHINQDHSS